MSNLEFVGGKEASKILGIHQRTWRWRFCYLKTYLRTIRIKIKKLSYIRLFYNLIF